MLTDAPDGFSDLVGLQFSDLVGLEFSDLVGLEFTDVEPGSAGATSTSETSCRTTRASSTRLCCTR